MQAVFNYQGLDIHFDVPLDINTETRKVAPPAQARITARKCLSSPVIAFVLEYEATEAQLLRYRVVSAVPVPAA
jgi:hypothetical protein